MSLSFCKFTIVMTFLRAIDGTGKRLAGIFLWFNGIAAFVVNTVTVGIMLGTCTPVEKNYNPKIHGTCFSPQVFARVVLAQGSKAGNMFLLSSQLTRTSSCVCRNRLSTLTVSHSHSTKAPNAFEDESASHFPDESRVCSRSVCSCAHRLHRPIH